MSDDAQEWRWVGEDGAEKTVTEQELIAELSSESLPNYTLVWKKGWLEWLPAMQVAELLWALPPGKVDVPVKPREKEGALSPPAPPLYRYPVMKRRAASLKGDKPAAAFAVPRPGQDAKKASSSPAAAAPPAAKIAPAQVIDPPSEPSNPEITEPRRRPAPEPPTEIWKPLDSRPFEEVEIDSIEASNPGASAEERDEDATLVADDDHELIAPEESDPAASGFDPPTAAFTARYTEEDDAATRVLPSKPPPPGPMYVGPHLPRASERPAPSYDDAEDDLPRIPPPPAPPADLSLYAGVARDGEDGQRARRVYVMGGLAVAAAAALLALVIRGGREQTTSVAPQSTEAAARLTTTSKSAPAIAKPRREPAACTIVTQATKIAEWADPAITPAFAAIPGSERVVIGFGQSGTYAIGITIDPRTLDHDQVFREFRHDKLVSVVPTAKNGELHFQVVRDGFTLANARSIDAATPFFLGATANGIERLVGKGDASPVWPFADADKETVPRVATVDGVGHAVALRRGGLSGRISIGYLNPSGDRQTDLADIRVNATFVGTPAVAANDGTLLVAFAARTERNSPWTLALAQAKFGELPKDARAFPIPSGGPGGNAISPAIGPLAGDRWLLQWTEGSSGNRVARAQVLDRALSPISDPVNLSPEGANAGQGAVWAKGDVGTILYYVQNDKKSHELWGTSVQCTR